VNKSGTQLIGEISRRIDYWVSLFDELECQYLDKGECEEGLVLELGHEYLIAKRYQVRSEEYIAKLKFKKDKQNRNLIVSLLAVIDQNVTVMREILERF